MAFGKEQLKAELIERALSNADTSSGKDRADRAARFLRSFYRRVPPDEIVGESPENLYGAAMSMWSFYHQRASGLAKVRVYSPSLETHGWESPYSVIEIVNDDMPFLVDSVVAAMQWLGAEVRLLIHPVLIAERSEAGDLLDLHERDDEATGVAESIIHLQVSEQRIDDFPEISSTVSSVLDDVRAAVEDWGMMRDRCAAIRAQLDSSPPLLPEDEIEEGAAFLDWLDDDHFTYLGYREYTFEGDGADAVAQVTPGTGLGILRNDTTTVFAPIRSLNPMPAHARRFLRRPELLVISKADRRSTVHRPVQLDAVSVKVIGTEGDVVGQKVFVGLFTSVAYAARPSRIPVLRRKVASVMGRSGIAHASHDGKAMTHILDSYPRDELFQITDDDLFEIATGILNLQERSRIGFFPRRDAFERFVSCLVFVPRDRFDTELRLRFQEILAAAFEGTVTDYYTHLTDSKLARLHVIVKTTPGEVPEVDPATLLVLLEEAARTWSDDLRVALVASRGERAAEACLRFFGDAFPPAYQHHFNASTAVADIGYIEQALDSGLALNLYRPIDADELELRLKTYVAGQRVPLSEVLPMLEDMGLRIIEEVPYKIAPADHEDPVWIRELIVHREQGTRELDAFREQFHHAFTEVWLGEMESDGFNRLVIAAAMPARDVTILRALCRYLLQARIPFSQTYMERTLGDNPEISRLLVELFDRRLDPNDEHENGGGTLDAAIEKHLEAVTQLDEDRIIRRFRNLINAIVRTNCFFSPAANGGEIPVISFKIDSSLVRDLPKPRPSREIFIYCPRFEAIHLRGGPVARGGIRWSNRQEDFRSEVLGLMKAQMVKNSVIVPVGSKGGFVVKRPPADHRQLLDEVVACYRSMMQAMLDLTDNLAGNQVVPPAGVRRLDGDDPYLVVAADKGTATFSDIANEISVRHGFWLGDAFASGGSAGYDHKAMGITARGAWESVKRHFRELDKDIQKEDVTVVGVGDMSGDVFGNGMLLSRHIRLLGAFNHLHIFVDPKPDPSTSFDERRRLFELPQSTWADYDRSLISKGGGVFDRNAKSIAISPQMRNLFGIQDKQLTPNDLIRCLLGAEVELLWFGGIGTYVKARDETDAMVADRANDQVRVSAADLRAKVVGEGANLALTQRARIELSQLGGRVNTDSIDNSAGVDTSDHEVNIKILLAEVESSGDLTRRQRDDLLREMTDEVAQLVLRDNYLQTQAITVSHRLGARLSDRTARFIRELERHGRLDRRIEFLPDEETLAERIQRGTSFTRPEIAVLLSYAKMELYDELLASDLPDDDALEDELRRYFPKAIQDRFPAAVARHRLRREIVATVVTNDIVNRVGIAFLREVRERTGRLPADIARAYVISREIFGMRDLWRRIEALDSRMPASVQAAMLAECGRLIERGSVWFLRKAGEPLDIRAEIATYGEGLRVFGEMVETLLPENEAYRIGEKASGFVSDGAPEDLAASVARLPALWAGCDIVRTAGELEIGVAEVGEIYFEIGAKLGFASLRRAAGLLPTDSAWDKLAVTAILDDLFSHQSELTRRVLEDADDDRDMSKLDQWVEGRRSQLAQTELLLNEIQSATAPNLSMLAVANRQLRSLST